jgi:hypothetical protein
MILPLWVFVQLLPVIAPAQSPAPLVVRFPETMQAGRNIGPEPQGLTADLIGSWASKAMDKQSAPRVAAFREATAGLDFVAAVQESLKCLGVLEPRTMCRELLTLPAAQNGKELAAQLLASGVMELVMIDVVPLLTDEHFRVRAFVTEMTVSPKGLSPIRSYGAVYDSRAPADLIDSKNADRLKAFWREGEPSRIERESRAATQELERALSFVREQSKPGEGRPAFAKELPKIKELKESGRVGCGGTACGQARVVRDFGSRIWLTSDPTYGTYGPVIISVDENAAKHSVNPVLLVMLLD